MKKSFMDELTELCEGRGYEIKAIDLEGDVVEVIIKREDEEAKRNRYKLQPAFPEMERV